MDKPLNSLDRFLIDKTVAAIMERFSERNIREMVERSYRESLDDGNFDTQNVLDEARNLLKRRANESLPESGQVK